MLTLVVVCGFLCSILQRLMRLCARGCDMYSYPMRVLSFQVGNHTQRCVTHTPHTNTASLTRTCTRP